MKVYGIYECCNANDNGQQIVIVSSKSKAVDYIRNCISDANKFAAVETSEVWYKANWNYSEEETLNRKNILNFRYIGKHNGYYVKEIDVL